MDSIVNSVKAYLGIMEDDDAFDSDLIMAINAIMFVLNQFGVGPSEPFVVEDSSQTWDELLGDKPIGGVREYVNLRVKMLFDLSRQQQAMQQQIAELQARLPKPEGSGELALPFAE